MDFHVFEARARELYREVPEQFLIGIDGLEVSLSTAPHPTLPDVYTLGECVTEQYPSEFGGAGEVRSVVVLHYGSFLALSRLDEEFDWEEELYETLMHEVRHHLESLATEDELEEIDFAEDQNFRRRQGEDFDPFFYRSGRPHDKGEWEVDGDYFVEHEVDREAAGKLEVTWRERRMMVDRPDPLGDVHFLTIEHWGEPEHEVVAVLLPRRGWWEWIRAFASRRPMRVLVGRVG